MPSFCLTRVQIFSNVEVVVRKGMKHSPTVKQMDECITLALDFMKRSGVGPLL